MNKFLNYIFVPQCIFCGNLFSDFCLGCLSKCLSIEKNICFECKNFSPHGLTHRACLKSNSPTVLYSLFTYSGVVSECIRRSKYFRKEFASLNVLINYGMKSNRLNLFQLEDFELLSVPLSKERMKSRGFNQSDLLVRHLSKTLNFSILRNTVLRIRNTEAQYTKDKFERKKNLLKAFKVVKNIEERKILIVDDIFTTGSTMSELSKTLYNAGAKEVRCFALSRVLST